MSFGIPGLILNNGLSGALLDYYSAYEEAYSAAQAAISISTLGPPTYAQFPPDLPDTSSRAMAFIYAPPNIPSNPNPPQDPGGPPTIVQVTSTPNPTTIVFDIDLNAPNMVAAAQSIRYTEISRQSYDQTAVGYHVNEWGMAIGRLDIDALVIFRGQAVSQVQQIFSFIQRQKNSNPLNTVKQGGQLTFVDAYLERQLILSLESISIEEVAGLNNQAHLVMSAGILLDYSSPSSLPSTTSSGSTSSIAQLVADGAAALESVLSFSGVSFP